MTAPTKPDLSQLTVDQVRDQLIQITYDVAAAHNRPVGSISYRDVAHSLGIPEGNCVNASDGRPACLIGQWLVRFAGVDPMGFSDWVAAGSNDAVLALTNITWGNPVLTFLSDVQVAQDQGSPWLNAIQSAYVGHRLRHPAG